DPVRPEAAVNAAAFNDDGTLVVTVSEDRFARVWDAKTGKPGAEPLKHEGPVKDVSISADARLMVTVSRENSARVWDTASWKPVAGLLTHQGAVRAARFSPDGKYVVTASEDKSARIWLISLPGTAPEWLPTLAESVGGYRLGEAGGAELVENAWADLSKIKNLLATSSLDDPFVRWGNWFLSDRATRTIAPFSATTVAQYVSRRAEEGTLAALNEALDLQPNSGLALGRLAVLSASKSDKTEADVRRADYWSRLGADYEPKNADVLWMRGYILQVQTNLEPAAAIMEKAISLDARNLKTFGPAGRDIASRNKEGTRSAGWLPSGWTDESSAGVVGVTYTKLTDSPDPATVAIRVETVGQRDAALLRGPRFFARTRQKFAIEGWIRSDKVMSLTVTAKSIAGPVEKYAEQFVRPTPEWKKFRVPINALKDVGGEVMLQVPAGTNVDIAGVVVVAE
ncbi:MAG: hypothetical protein AB1705_28555, partial [Verrucomicrobiota bacterium]